MHARDVMVEELGSEPGFRWAHQVAGMFPDGQLYVNLRGLDPALPPMSATEATRLALDALEVPAEGIPATLDAQAGLYRTVLAGKKVLILADNAAGADQPQHPPTPAATSPRCSTAGIASPAWCAAARSGCAVRWTSAKAARRRRPGRVLGLSQGTCRRAAGNEGWP